MKVLCFTLVLLVSLTAVALGEEDEENMMERVQKDMDACQASEKASEDDLDSFKAREAPTTKEGKCFVGCFFERFGIMEDGAFSRKKADEKAKASSMAQEPEVLDLILKANEDCEKEVGPGTDKCETGPKLAACFKKAHDNMKK